MSVIFPHIFRTEHSETHTTNSEYGEHFASRQRGKISVGPTLARLMQHVDSHVYPFINDLSDAISIKSVSGSMEHRLELVKMIQWAEGWLKKLELKYECFYVGYYEINGQNVRIPPVILAHSGNDPKKRTVCVYGHLDVCLPKLDEWKTDPWNLTQTKKRFYGSGTATGKGVLLCWFHAIWSFKKTNIPLPVNIKFIIESMYHQRSKGLSQFLQTRKLDFFSNVDCIVSCQGEWIGEKYPCIIYGTVGHSIFDIIAEEKDGSCPEKDLEEIVSKIYDKENEKILIPNFDDFVKQITPDEEGIYEAIQEFDVEKIRPSLPPKQQKWDKVKLLMHFWRLSDIHIGENIHCTCNKKNGKVVKRQIVVKLVQNQVTDNANSLFKSYVKEQTTELDIKSDITCKLISSIRYWSENIKSWNYEAARKAAIQVYKEEPSFIREDHPLTSISTLDGNLEKNILVLPLVENRSNIGESNENISYRNFFEGTKLLMAYLLQLSIVEYEKKSSLC